MIDRPRVQALVVAAAQLACVYIVASIKPVDPLLWYPLIIAMSVHWLGLVALKLTGSERSMQKALRHGLLVFSILVTCCFIGLKAFAPRSFLSRAVGKLAEPTGSPRRFLPKP